MAFLEPWWHMRLCKENYSPLAPARGARQDLGRYRTLELFISVGIRIFFTSLLPLAEGAQYLPCKWLPGFCAFPWIAPAQTRSLLLAPAGGCAGAAQPSSAV